MDKDKLTFDIIGCAMKVHNPAPTRLYRVEK